MKFRTTQKEIKNGYTHCINVSYCALQTLLNYETPTAYTSGVYGWGADIYTFGNTAIITGYSPFGKIRPDSEIIKRYEKQAETILYNRSTEYTETRQQLRNLIDLFIQEVTQQ